MRKKWILSAPELDREPTTGDYVPDTVAAKMIGSTPATLRRWRHEGRYLRYFKVGSSVRYLVADLQEFLLSRVVEVSDAPNRGDAE